MGVLKVSPHQLRLYHKLHIMQLRLRGCVLNYILRVALLCSAALLSNVRACAVPEMVHCQCTAVTAAGFWVFFLVFCHRVFFHLMHF